MSGIDSSAYHFVAKGQLHAFISGAIYRFKWSILSGLVFIVGSFYWFSQEEFQLGWMFIIAGISFPFTYAMTSSSGYFGAQGFFNRLFWYRIAESLTDFFGFIPLIFSMVWISQGITFYSYNQLASAIMQVGTTILIIQQIRRNISQNNSNETKKEMIQYGKHLTAINGISVFQSRFDAWLVGITQTLDTTADYTIALMVQEQLRKLWGIYSTMRYPALVKLAFVTRKKQILREGIFVWIGLSMAGGLILVLAHWLIPILLPISYVNSLQYINIFVFALLLGVPGGIAEMFFKLNQNSKMQYKIRMYGAIYGIAFPLLLISNYGAYGAAFGRMIANLLFSITATILLLFSKEELIYQNETNDQEIL